MVRYAFLALLGAILSFASVGPALTREAAQQYPTLQAATTTDVSFNWAGYVAQGGRYSGISGSWTVPTVAADAASAGSPVAADATWVGIGGVTGGDLLQAGTQAIVSGGEVYYQAWVEGLPGASQTLPIGVAPGDQVSVSLSQLAPGRWQVAFYNLTSGKRYQTSVAYDSSLSSAEWVEEMPSTARGSFIPLSDFGVVHFISGSAIQNGDTVSIADAGARPLAMVDRRGDALAATSVLSAGGFTVTRAAAVAAAPRSRGLEYYSRRAR